MLRRPSSIRDELLRPPVEYNPPRRKDNLFLWTVFLLLLVGFTMACWIGSYVVFSRPELPISYRLLRKIKKIDEPQRFKVNAAPPGEFLGSERLYNRYNALSAPALRELNRSLERAYLRNYPTSNELVPYVTGRFTIMECYELRSNDFIPSGVVAVAVSADYPKLLIEHVYSSSAQDAPIIRRNLQTGMDIELRRTFELSAVLHVLKLNDGRIQLTVVPINYGRYVFTGSSGGFELQPPAALNVAAGWPIVRGDRLESASQAYVDFRTRSGLGPLTARANDSQRPAPTALKGVNDPVEATPAAPGSTPVAGGPAATPPVVAKGPDAGKLPPTAPGGSPAASPANALLARNDLPVRAALPVNEPFRRPDALPPATNVVKAAASIPAPNAVVPLQRFLDDPTAPPAPAATGTMPRSTWPMYAPGKAPTGKNVHVADMAALNQHGVTSGEPMYLSGQFVVRAVGENKLKGVRTAVMRSSSDSNVRVIVEFPSDRPLPSEGAEVVRDEQRPYQIMDVRRVADGTINVFAREVTAP